MQSKKPGDEEPTFHPIAAKDERGPRKIAVVLGLYSVSIVQDPKMRAGSSIYSVTTLTAGGIQDDADMDHVLLKNPVHAWNMAKGLLTIDPDFI